MHDSSGADSCTLDREGYELRRSGGTILLQGNKDWYGVGHNGICATGDKDYIIYHGYDATDKGRPKVRVQELRWDAEKWPFLLISDLFK